MTEGPQSPTPSPRGASRWTIGIPLALFAMLASIVSWQQATVARIADLQPGCDPLPHRLTAGALAILALALFITASIMVARARWLPAIALALTLAGTACFASVVVASGLARARVGAVGVHVSASLRAVSQARHAAEEDGDPHAETLFLLLHARSLTPEILFLPCGCPYWPPGVTADEFDYQGITAEDALLRRVSTQQITDAARASLGDEPWERLSWAWYLRDARPYRDPIDPEIIVGGGIICTLTLRAYVLHADGTVNIWRPTDPDLEAKLQAATTAAERHGVAPPPRELIDFVNTPPEPRR
ncbi:MAG: hypothetical protein ACTS3F_12875 [Phycisphaerales bacterium]